MVDVYSIAFKADTRDVRKAKEDVSGLGGAAGKSGRSVSNFGRQVDDSTRQVNAMGKATDLATRAVTALGAAVSVRAFQQFASTALQSAQNIERQARALGISAEEFQRLSFAFRQFGADTNDISDALNTLADRAEDAKQGTQSFIDDFQLVGIEVDELRGKKPDELFRLFAREVASVEDPTRRAAGVVRILGDDVGRRLLPMLQQGEEGLDRLGRQAQVASDQVISATSQIQTDLAALGTELQTGLQNAFLGFAAENEAEIRSLIATSLRGMAQLVEFGDEAAGPLGAGVLGRVLFGTRGAVIGTLLASTVQTINAIIDRANESVGQELARVEEEIARYERILAESPRDLPGISEHLVELRQRREELDAQVQDSIEYQNDYNEAINEGGDLGERVADSMRKAADNFERSGEAVQTITGPDALPKVVAGVESYSTAMQEALGITVDIPGALGDVASSTDEVSEKASELKDAFAEIGTSVGEALVEEDWDDVGSTIGDLLGNSLANALSDEIGSALSGIGQNIGGTVGGNIGASIGTALGSAVGGAAGAAAGSFIGQELEDFFSGSEYDLEAVQARQNTGTILGSIDQKSSSIDNSLQEIESATAEIVNINRGMLRSLQQVQNNLFRAAARIAGQEPGAGISAPAGPSQGQQALGGLQATSLGLVGAGLMSLNPITLIGGVLNEVLGGPLDGLLEGIAGTIDDIFGGVFSDIGSAIFGGGTSVVDRGVQILGGELGARMDETLIRAFARIKEDGGWFSSDDYYNRFADVPGDVNRQFQLVLGEIVNAVRQGAEALGVLPQDIQNRLDAFVLETRRISLKGLDASEQQEEIQAAFSAIFDNLANAIVPFAKDFQNAGEGIGETIARIATQVGILEEAALTLGGSLTGISGRGRTEAAVDLSESLGGTEQFAQALAQLESNFFTAAEQFEINGRRLRDALGDLPLPETRQGFLDLAKSQDISTASGRDNLATLLSLQNSADEYYDFLEKTDETQKSINEVQQERDRLERELLEVQGNASALRKLELESIDESNRALQQRIWRLEDEAAVERENDRLTRQLLEVQGDTSAIRALELDSLDESNRELQKRIWRLEDEAAIQQEQEQLENELLQVQGKTSEIRQQELDQLDPTNRELQKRIWRLQDEQEVFQERSSLETELLELQGKTGELRQKELDSLFKSNRPLQERIWNLQEEKERQEELAAEQERIAQERAGLEIQLLRVQGDTNEIRRAELEQLAPSNRVLQRRIWRLQDEQQVLQERSALENELLQAYSRSAAMFRQQIAGMTSENAALQIAINLRENVANAQQQVNQAEQDLVNAYQREISTLESRKSVYQDNINTAEQLAETWKGLTETLRESADELLGLGISEPTASRSSFQQTLTAALGGDREAFEALPQLATDLSEAERSQAGTLAEARRANARIASELDKAADQAEKQYLEQLSEKEIAQRSLDRLDEQILQNNRQIEKLTEQELTLEQAKANVAKAEATLKAAQDANTQAINKLQELLPNSIINGLMEPLSPLQQIDASTQAMVDLLGSLNEGGTVNDTGTNTPLPEFSGGGIEFDRDYYLGQKRQQLNRIAYEGKTDWTIPQILQAFEEEGLTPREHYEEYGREEGISPAPGFADGGIASGPMSGFQATLHGTEAVIPLNGDRIPLEVNNHDLVMELREVKQELAQLRSEQEQSQYELVKYTKRNNRQFEQWDIDGLPETRTA